MIERSRFGFLQLFNEGAAAAGGDQGAGGSGGQSQGTEAGAGGQSAPPAGGQGGPGGQGEWTPEKDTAFAKRLEAERGKIRSQVDAELRKQYEADLRLAKVFRDQGYDPTHIATEWERQALEMQAQQAGLPSQVYQQFQQLQSQVQSLTQERMVQSLQTEAKALEQEFGPVFSQHAQAAIDRAAKTGETLEEAFFAVGRRDILKAQQGRTEQQVLAQVTGRDGKAPVTATGGPQVTPQNDVWSMSKDEFEKLRKDVKAGRRTNL